MSRPASLMPRWGWLLAYLLLAFAFWGVRPLWEPDEGRYGEAARQMVITGDWLVPHLQGHPHLTKPPLTYWLAALGLRISGVSAEQPIGNPWGGRLFISLAFFGTMICTVAIGRTWGWSPHVARLGGLVFGSAALPFVCGRVLTTDMLLTFWETLGVLCALRTWHGGGHTARWRTGYWLAFTMAFLTKGPPGLLPMLAIVAYRWLRPRREGEGRLWSPVGLAGLLVGGLLWYVILIIQDRSRFWYFIGYEVIDRLVSDDHGRSKPLVFYLVIIPFGMMPWLHAWGPLVRGVWRRVMRGGGILRRLRALDDEALFALLWVVLPLLVFTVAGSKMFFYIVPLLVPIALWMARCHVRMCGGLLPRSTGWRRFALGTGGLWIAVLIAFTLLPDSVPFGDSYLRMAQVVRGLPLGDRDFIYVYGGQPHSVSFYSNVRLVEREEGETTTPFLEKMQSEANYQRTFLLIRTGQENVLDERGVRWREVALQHDWHLVEISPHPR